MKKTILFLLAAAALVSCSNKQEMPEADNRYAVMTVGTSPSELKTSYPATIKGVQDVEIRPKVSGFITKMNAEEIGETSVVLGAGRETKESDIDFSAGLILHKKYGDEVKEGDTLVTLYTSKESALADAEKMYRDAIAIGDVQPAKEPLVYARVEKDKVEKY